MTGENGYEFTDRYGDGPRPDPETMCLGQCEGLGVYPVQDGDAELSMAEISALLDAKQREADAIAKGTPVDRAAGDTYYFIRCPDCAGTGKREVAS